VLTADRRLNPAMTFRSGAGDASIVGVDRQFNIGAFFSSPLVAGGTVYLGSTDGNLYALE
jgi:outer membrane protein assembly factor BamB